MMLVGGLLGLIIGAILGLTGAGGGIFAVPALVFGLGLEIRVAAPVALLAVGTAAAFGAWQGLRQGIVRYRAALVLAAAGAMTAPIGIKVAHWLPSAWLNMIFVCVILVVAYRMAVSSGSAQADAAVLAGRGAPCKVSTETGRFIWKPRTAVTLAGIGAITGMFTGMLGVGGGFIIVPALGYVSDLRMHSIVATSLMVIALLSAVTVLAAGVHGLSLTAATAAFSVATLVGMACARSFASRIPSTVLQRLFAIACLVVAAMMLMRDIS